VTHLAIVIPAYNAEDLLAVALPAVLTAAGDEKVLVVDAGSTDGTAAVAERLGVEVLRLPHRVGPAEARNAGVAHTSSELLLFVDSDCATHEDAVRRVVAAFEADPQLVALSGSYDADPPEPNFFSQYMNLRHHLTHQWADRDTPSFWAGCGAVRRSAFQRVGGFDAVLYPRPMIEDIELSTRLAPLGPLRFDPEIQVTHLKHWSARGVVETDLRCRALPWARLIAATGRMPDTLNLDWRERASAALAPLALLSLLALPIVWIQGPPVAVAISAGIPAAALALGWRWVRGFARLRGAAFACRAWLFHQVHQSYSGAAFGLFMLRHHLRRLAAGRPPTEP
jgi:GT2 family glycosyltransferase